ncbi:DUF1648 domain-containing protein [Thermococcus sp. JCM 11816]|uniref:DUF1648 domain-containing protein n=1 Tax=Thermococcus sp. (strain JCM 11816 / KS-1) TaxID=1295125 RepID=UPI000A7EF712
MIQLLGLIAYIILAAILWDKLPPERVAIHFNASGEPDNFASKTLGTLLFPLVVYPLFLVMTYFLREPAFAPLLRFSRRGGWKAFAEFTTIMAIGIVIIDSLVLLYNAGQVPSSWIGYSVWTFLIVTIGMIFRLFWARGEET